MNLNKKYCTPAQSEILLTLGLAHANYSWVFSTVNNRFEISNLSYEAHQLLNRSRNKNADPERIVLPAFDVAELGEMLPECISGRTGTGKYYATPDDNFIMDLLGIDFPPSKNSPWCIERETEAEARGALLLFLLEHGQLTPNAIKELIK